MVVVSSQLGSYRRRTQVVREDRPGAAASRFVVSLSAYTASLARTHLPDHHPDPCHGSWQETVRRLQTRSSIPFTPPPRSYLSIYLFINKNELHYT